MLEQVITNDHIQAPKGIIYGLPGIGKSTFAAESGALIIDAENGLSAIRCDKTPYLDSYESMMQWLHAVQLEDHEYRAVAIDTVDWLIRRLEEHVAGTADQIEATLNKSHGGWGVGKQILTNYVYRQFLPMLDRIVERGIAVILLGHAKRTTITDAEGVTTEKTHPDLPDHIANTLIEWADFVCLAYQPTGSERMLVAQEKPFAMAKNRYRLPETLPLNWSEFQSAISVYDSAPQS